MMERDFSVMQLFLWWVTHIPGSSPSLMFCKIAPGLLDLAELHFGLGWCPSRVNECVLLSPWEELPQTSTWGGFSVWSYCQAVDPQTLSLSLPGAAEDIRG